MVKNGKPGWVSRAVDTVAEWLLPDPTARVERALREFQARERGERGSDEKPPPKG